MAITDNLVSYWKLDESSGNASDSVGSNTLTNSNVTYSSGKINNGSVFSGTSTLYNSSMGLSASTTFSFAGWCKWTDSFGSTFIYTTGTNNAIIKIDDNAGVASYGYVTGLLYDGSNHAVVSTTNTFNDGNWHHIAYVVNGANQYLYIDGKLNNSAATGGSSYTISTLRMSTYNGSGQPYAGTSDEWGLWTRALSAAEVAYLYNNGRGVQYPDMQHNTLGEYLGAGVGITKGLYHLNGSSADYSGNGNNGTDTAITYSLANGKFGMGASFNNVNDKIQSTLSNITTNATISIWLNLTSLASDWTNIILLDNNRGTGNSRFQISISNTNKYTIGDNYGSTELITTTTPTTGSWVNLIGVLSDGDVELFLNGVSIGSKAGSINLNDNTMIIGKSDLDNSFIGSIDEVIIENVAWSAEKVKKYYTYAKGRFGIN